MQLEDVVKFVLEEAARQGATQAAADASINQGLGVTARLGEVETVEYQRDRGLGVTVYFGHRKGSASTADLGMKAVRDTVEKACTIARYTAEDPYAGLVDPEALAWALDHGVVEGAWFDGFYREQSGVTKALAARPEVHITPHVAWLTHEACDGMAAMAVESILNVLRHGDDDRIVNR